MPESEVRRRRGCRGSSAPPGAAPSPGAGSPPRRRPEPPLQAPSPAPQGSPRSACHIAVLVSEEERRKHWGFGGKWGLVPPKWGLNVGHCSPGFSPRASSPCPWIRKD